MIHAVTSKPDFLQNLDRHIENHLSDSNLKVDQLLRLLAMSRSNLHRKLERTVQMSITAYLRNYRLRKAATILLEKQDMNISQVAMEVGFNSPSYFAARFREKYGHSPSAFRKLNGTIHPHTPGFPRQPNNTNVNPRLPQFCAQGQFGTYVIFFYSKN